MISRIHKLSISTYAAKQTKDVLIFVKIWARIFSTSEQLTRFEVCKFIVVLFPNWNSSVIEYVYVFYFILPRFICYCKSSFFLFLFVISQHRGDCLEVFDFSKSTCGEAIHIFYCRVYVSFHQVINNSASVGTH